MFNKTFTTGQNVLKLKAQFEIVRIDSDNQWSKGMDLGSDVIAIFGVKRAINFLFPILSHPYYYRSTSIVDGAFDTVYLPLVLNASSPVEHGPLMEGPGPR